MDEVLLIKDIEVEVVHSERDFITIAHFDFETKEINENI